MKWLGLLVLAAACATAVGVIRGHEAGDEILFPHSKHLAAKVECITCHESVYDAKTLKGGEFLPNEAKCLECHRAWKEEKKCEKCHSAVQYAGAWPRREAPLNFNHAFHIEKFGEDCTRCHARLDEPRKPAPITAGHDTCMQCHEHEQMYADAQCSKCHTTLANRPVTQLSHEGGFLKRHGVLAKADSASCAQCHADQSFCLDCHARTAATKVETKLFDRPDRAFIHRDDFLSRHPIEARADAASCQKCHSASSCESCHRVENVAQVAGGSARNPHPPGWAIPGAGAQFHGDAARRDITSCAACHDEGEHSNCITCHRVGGVGGNPHPPGFTARHSGEERKTTACLACHL